MASSDRVYYGALVNPIDIRSVDFLPQALIAVSNDGTIAWVERQVDGSLVQAVLANHNWSDVDLIELGASE